MDTDPSLLEELGSRLLDGSLEDHEREMLLKLAEADPAILAAIREQLVVSAALSSLLTESTAPDFAESVISHVRSVGDEPDGEFSSKVIARIHRSRRQRVMLAVAAVVALVGIPLSFLVLRPAETGPAVAIAFNLSDRSNVDHTEVIHVGKKIDLQQGIMRFEFKNGAIIAVESPASLTITSANEILLRSGKLNGWCPESAHGFRINTRSAVLTDKGTSFGVDAANDGSANFLVLDGKVTVSAGGESRDLVKGNAVRATTKSKLHSLAFEPSAFTRTWPVASGIQSTRGEVVPAPPNTPEIVAAHEDDGHVIVIPERRDFVVPIRLPADIRDPGSYEKDNLLLPRPLESKPGTTVRSFLLRYNPVGKLMTPDFKLFEGSVTFDRPVLAIIASSKKLDLTDLICSYDPLPLTEDDRRLRGLERGQPPNPSDRVVLSEDRRTVSVVFIAGESVDEIRVITADQ
jgi:hypothetical protein